MDAFCFASFVKKKKLTAASTVVVFSRGSDAAELHEVIVVTVNFIL